MRILILLILLGAAASAETVRVRVPADSQPDAYRGELRQSGKYVINVIELEDYLRGVVPKELNCQEPEAMKAQAVVARTYALSHLRPSRPYDFEATDKSQVYGGKAAELTPADVAVEETAGETLQFQNQLARHVMYHSTCGGGTEDNERVFGGEPVEYLRGRPCTHCSPSPYYRWILEVGVEEIGQELERRLGKPVQPLTGLEPLQRHPGGRVSRLGVLGATAGLELRGDDMRRYLWGWNSAGQRKSLPSTRFTVQTVAGRIRLEGQGWGHGVGMCQWGAVGMAREGKTYREILAEYFAGAEVGGRDAVSERPGGL